MVSQPELPVQQKREVEKKPESTIPSRTFLPITDIFETDQALTVILEMPGVDKEKVDVNVENDILTIEGRIDYSGSSWNRVGDFWVENATKLGIAREFCILRDLEFEHD